MIVDELLIYLFEEHSHPLASALAMWLRSSRRFTTFVTTFRDKIRKKLRAPQDGESLQDIRLELETAYLLLQERTLSVVYEPQPVGKMRAPDFAVTFTTSLTFMVEVTRLRASPTRSPAGQEPTPSPVGERLADAICSKLGQLLPQRSNVLLVGVEATPLSPSDLHAVMRLIQQRAEANDATLLQRHHFRDRADFFRHYGRLSEILGRGVQLPADESVTVWVNPQATHPLPGKVRTALYRSHRAAGV